MASFKFKAGVAAALLALSGLSSASTCTGATAATSVGTDPSSFSMFFFSSAGVSTAVDCYSFTTTSDFKINGYFNYSLNLDSGGIELNGVNLNNSFSYNGNTGALSKTFAAGTYELQMYLNGTGHAGNPDIWGGKAFITAVPEPETYAMMLAGLGPIGFMARRRQIK